MRGYFSIFFLIIFLCISFNPSEGRADNVITIAADEWCPINCAAKSSQQGIGIDLARTIFESQGYKIKYVIMPWTKALDQVRAGKVTAVIGASKSDDKTLVFPDTQVAVIGDDFFVRSGSGWRYQGVSSLKNKRLGIIEDYGYGDVVTGFIKQNQYTAGVLNVAKGKTPLEDNINELLNSKIDVIVESKIVMDYTLSRSDKAGKIVHAGRASEDPVFLAFSPALPESKRLAAIFDTSMRQMRTSGTLKSMYGAYGLTP